MHVMLADLLGWDMTDRGGPYPQMAQTKKMQTLFAPPPQMRVSKMDENGRFSADPALGRRDSHGFSRGHRRSEILRKSRRLAGYQNSKDGLSGGISLGYTVGYTVAIKAVDLPDAKELTPKTEIVAAIHNAGLSL